MRRALTAGALAAAAIMAVPSQAAVTTYFTNGSYAYPFATTATVFQSFESDPIGLYTAKAGEAVSGNVLVQTGNVPGISADPDPANTGGTKFLDIVTGSYSVTLSTPAQFFSFLLGSLDIYNSVTLTFADNSTSLLTGAQIVGQSTVAGAPGTFNSTGNSNVAGRVTYDTGGTAGITSVQFSTTQAAFEIDALASAVPEPATWGLMILGIGAAGAGLRVRRKEQLATA